MAETDNSEVEIEGGESQSVEVRIAHACREVLAPLVAVDGGELYIVSVSEDEVRLHLAGQCSGCPGASLTRERIIRPVVAAIASRASLVVTTGLPLPKGAKRANAGDEAGDDDE